MTRGHCLKCGTPKAAPDAIECAKCGAVFAKLEAAVASGQIIRSVTIPDPAARKPRPPDDGPATTAELVERARRTGNWTGVPVDLIHREAGVVTLTTTESVPGFSIEAVGGIVSSQHAHAMGALEEMVTGAVRNVVGSGRSSGTEQLVANARQEVLRQLRYQALDLGCNAVVGLRLGFEEISGSNQRGALVLIGYGTAVRVRSTP